jgi:orotidine-5'-phosphate decarboxylase
MMQLAEKYTADSDLEKHFHQRGFAFPASRGRHAAPIKEQASRCKTKIVLPGIRAAVL